MILFRNIFSIHASAALQPGRELLCVLKQNDDAIK